MYRNTIKFSVLPALALAAAAGTSLSPRSTSKCFCEPAYSNKLQLAKQEHYYQNLETCPSGKLAKIRPSQEEYELIDEYHDFKQFANKDKHIDIDNFLKALESNGMYDLYSTFICLDWMILRRYNR